MNRRDFETSSSENLLIIPNSRFKEAVLSSEIVSNKKDLFQSNTPLACCWDEKLPRYPLMIYEFSIPLFDC
jgi:hypothetical protein